MCDFCEHKEDLGFDWVGAKIRGSALELDYSAYSVDSSFEDELKINYCPMCGRLINLDDESEVHV
jgi:hypothetical protein